MSALSLSCRCGLLTGQIRNVTPKYGTRLVCHCKDCQAFAHAINAGDQTLDAQCGADIYQTNPAQIRFEQGAEHLRCLRLTPKGTLRWYAGCCRTPIGNTVNAKLPFIGLIHTMTPNDRATAMGPVRLHVQTQDALPGLSAELENPGFPKKLYKKIKRKIIWWKLTGKSRPNPFFDQQGRPVSEPEIIDSDKPNGA